MIPTYPWAQLRAALNAFKEDKRYSDAQLVQLIEAEVEQKQLDHVVPNRVTVYRLLTGKTSHPKPQVLQTFSMIVDTASFRQVKERYLSGLGGSRMGEAASDLGKRLLRYVTEGDAIGLERTLGELFPERADEQNKATWLVRACAACVQQGVHDTAAAFARRALEAGDLTPARREQLRLLQAQILLGTSRFGEAIQLCEQFLELDEEQVQARFSETHAPARIRLQHRAAAHGIAGRARLRLALRDSQPALRDLVHADYLMQRLGSEGFGAEELRMRAWVCAARSEAEAWGDWRLAEPQLERLDRHIAEWNGDELATDEDRRVAMAYGHEAKLRIAFRAMVQQQEGGHRRQPQHDGTGSLAPISRAPISRAPRSLEPNGGLHAANGGSPGPTGTDTAAEPAPRAGRINDPLLQRALRLSVRESLGELAHLLLEIHEDDLVRSFLELRRLALAAGMESPLRPEGRQLSEDERKLRRKAAAVDPTFIDW